MAEEPEEPIIPDADPEDDDCDVDGCDCEVGEPTPDEDLPPAEGGVA
jgi:hypothetical protein